MSLSWKHLPVALCVHKGDNKVIRGKVTNIKQHCSRY